VASSLGTAFEMQFAILAGVRLLSAVLHPDVNVQTLYRFNDLERLSNGHNIDGHDIDRHNFNRQHIDGHGNRIGGHFIDGHRTDGQLIGGHRFNSQPIGGQPMDGRCIDRYNQPWFYLSNVPLIDRVRVQILRFVVTIVP